MGKKVEGVEWVIIACCIRRSVPISIVTTLSYGEVPSHNPLPFFALFYLLYPAPSAEDDEDEVDSDMAKDMDKAYRINYEEFADEFAKISLEISAAAEQQKERRVLVCRTVMCMQVVQTELQRSLRVCSIDTAHHTSLFCKTLAPIPWMCTESSARPLY